MTPSTTAKSFRTGQNGFIAAVHRLLCSGHPAGMTDSRRVFGCCSGVSMTRGLHGHYTVERTNKKKQKQKKIKKRGNF